MTLISTLNAIEENPVKPHLVSPKKIILKQCYYFNVYIMRLYYFGNVNSDILILKAINKIKHNEAIFLIQ